MQTDSKEIARMVESGEYYEQSRAWYEALYIGPVAERTFFLLIAGLASLVAFFAFLSLLSFLPLTERPGVLIKAKRIDERVPYLVPLKPRGMSMDKGFMQFFVTSYVTRREEYNYASYAEDYRFIYGQSDAPTFTDYNNRYSSANPQSPAALLGQYGKRLVTVHSVKISDRGDPKTATVSFTTQVAGNGEKTNWTAVLQFYYTDLEVTHPTDPETGEELIKTVDPTFKVVSYALTQTR